MNSTALTAGNEVKWGRNQANKNSTLTHFSQDCFGADFGLEMCFPARNRCGRGVINSTPKIGRLHGLEWVWGARWSVSHPTFVATSCARAAGSRRHHWSWLVRARIEAGFGDSEPGKSRFLKILSHIFYKLFKFGSKIGFSWPDLREKWGKSVKFIFSRFVSFGRFWKCLLNRPPFGCVSTRSLVFCVFWWPFVTRDVCFRIRHQISEFCRWNWPSKSRSSPPQNRGFDGFVDEDCEMLKIDGDRCRKRWLRVGFEVWKCVKLMQFLHFLQFRVLR